MWASGSSKSHKQCHKQNQHWGHQCVLQAAWAKDTLMTSHRPLPSSKAQMSTQWFPSSLWWQAGHSTWGYGWEVRTSGHRGAPGNSAESTHSFHLFLPLRRFWLAGKPSAWGGSRCLSTSTLPMTCWTCGLSRKRWHPSCPCVHLRHARLPSTTTMRLKGRKTGWFGYFELELSNSEILNC